MCGDNFMTAARNPTDPKVQAPPIPDSDLSADVPRIDIEEMLKDLTINDDGTHSRSHDLDSTHSVKIDSSGDVIMGTNDNY